ncbi:ATP-binding cassette domain-containing protein [Actinomadura livida]|uniref:ABC-2 type transport system ATP-binding protein n=1 Tax=Actinomadura livida TaxID=79909 RepID=A0A7W7IDU7_9ACTN|nr:MULTISPECIES: ATP-binding cassette domain-containing protein [Actinomadura]MBB4775288.1 ABC-2 type transport system ATP-binding protein [Actinomadura catellatispora]GGT89233.1 daunorubicin resistance protein DrrA family ABC transporter ATP-binding protein [Actinomadura livida]
MADPVVVAEGLHKSFGGVRALRGLDLSVPRGTVCGVLGPNGAGKTTAVRILATLADPDAGLARVAGYDVVREADEVRARIGLAGQYAAVDEKLTGRGNLRMFGRLSHLSRRAAHRRADELLERFGLRDAADRRVAGYSGGMRRRLDLVTSLILRPEVLFLDEPTTGLDPRGRGEIWDAVRELVADGTTVLLTTQYLEEADRLADDIAVVDRGKVIATGTPDGLKAAIGDRLDVVLEDPAALRPAAAVLHALAGNAPAATGAGRLSVALPAGGPRLAGVVRELDRAGVAAADVSLRRPTLDEVFLRLTGREEPVR